MGISVEGLKCPVCGAYIFDNDDLVFCPECGAPHHRDCYQSLGHCAFADKHGTDEQYDFQAEKEKAEKKQQESQRSQQPQGNLFGDEPPHFGGNTVPCQFCGEPLGRNERFCRKCGRQQMVGGTGGAPFGAGGPGAAPFGPGVTIDPLGGVAPNETIGDVTAEEVKDFVVANTHRYVPRFKAMKTFKRTSWNWAAFLVPEAWFFYRKMYLPGILVTTLMVITNLFMFPFSEAISNQVPDEAMRTVFTLSNYITQNFESFNAPPLYLAIGSVVGSLLIRILAGFFGDKIYFKTVSNGIKSVKSEDLDVDTPIETALARKGGVNTFLGLICLFGLDIVVNLIYVIFNSFI